MKKAVCYLSLLALFLAGSCTFDYGEGTSSNDHLPDLVMKDVEYVRVRSADPIAWFHADQAERYERQGIMKLENITFEQYNERGEETNIYGKAGNAVIQLSSADIFMDNGVIVEVKSEDIILDTYQLEWKDEDRLLSAGEGREVNIYRENGTRLTGRGFNADARRRSWGFSGSIRGTYIHEDTDE